MSASRANETPQLRFRSERVFRSNGQWFFHTREGVEVGPYDSRFEAEIEAGMLKELLRSREPGRDALAVIREFVLESYAMGRPLAPRQPPLVGAASRPRSQAAIPGRATSRPPT